MRASAPRRPLLLAGSATLLLPVLAWTGLSGEPPSPDPVPLRARPARPPRLPDFVAFGHGEAESGPAPAALTEPHACTDAALQAAELESLRAQLAAARLRCEELVAGLQWQEQVWEARLEREGLEAALRAWIARDHPDLLRVVDPVTEEPVAEELVELLEQVAETLGPTAEDESDGPGPVPQAVTLDDVRAVVSHGSIRRLADGLPRWNLAIALAPQVESFYRCGSDAPVRWPQLVEHALVDGSVREVSRRDLHPDDVRLELARAERRRAVADKRRQIEVVLGLRLFED